MELSSNLAFSLQDTAALEKWKFTFTQKLYLNIHGHTIYNNHKWKQLRCPLADEWTYKMQFIINS